MDILEGGPMAGWALASIFATVIMGLFWLRERETRARIEREVSIADIISAKAVADTELARTLEQRGRVLDGMVSSLQLLSAAWETQAKSQARLEAAIEVQRAEANSLVDEVRKVLWHCTQIATDPAKARRN